MHHPIAFLAEMMGNIMYLHQVLRQPQDAREFMEAVIKEVNGHNDNNHWKLIPRTEVPEAWRSYHQYGQCVQARLNDGKSHKAQGKAQPSRWEARIWHELLQNLRACGYMVCNLTSHCLWYPVQLGHLPS